MRRYGALWAGRPACPPEPGQHVCGEGFEVFVGHRAQALGHLACLAVGQPGDDHAALPEALERRTLEAPRLGALEDGRLAGRLRQHRLVRGIEPVPDLLADEHRLRIVLVPAEQQVFLDAVEAVGLDDGEGFSWPSTALLSRAA